MESTAYDVIIIGAGAAGLTAALYTSRRKLTTLVISKDLGGQAALTDKIFNYPGIMHTGGLPLMQQFRDQAAQYGATFEFQEVRGVQKDGDSFVVSATKGEYRARVVILAFGLTPRDLGVPGEAQFKDKDIFWAATEHGQRFAGKDIAIIGGGNSAFESAMFLQPIARKMYLVHRRDNFRGEEVSLQKIQQFKNLEFVLNCEVAEILGEGKLAGLRVKDVKTGVLRDLAVDAVCVNIGYAASTQWLGDLVDRNPRGHIEANDDTTTKTEGLFAAGDCTTSPYKQVITAGAEGCKAALKAYEYLMAKSGKRAVLIDWT